jgi:hypothetical protein
MADTTTARIYTSDAPKLLKLQSALHLREGEWPTVAEVIHRLIEQAEERGNVQE